MTTPRVAGLVLGCFALIASASTLRASEPDQTPPADPPPSLADRLLAETASAAEAARRWLKDHASAEALNGYANDAESAVVERFNRALEEAKQEHDATLGVFLYAPNCNTALGPWERPASGTALPPRVVLLVHGLDEGGGIWDNAAPALADAGHIVLRFNYPNDQPIPASADLLAAALRDLRTRDVRTVDLVGHSMGGLVARDVLTRPDYYNADARGRNGWPAIERFIMLGTPNNGAPLAPLRGAMEVRDQFVRWMNSEHKASSGLLGFMVDGGGEAGDDLRPDSAFLTTLNARPLPTHLAITIVIGEIAPKGRTRLVSALDSPYIRRVIGEDKAERWKAGTNGLWHDVGDGVVPTASADLQGVADIVRVQADHRSMIRVLEPLEAARDALGMDNPTPPAIPIILERLARPLENAAAD